jgi:uncharacterized protein
MDLLNRSVDQRPLDQEHPNGSRAPVKIITERRLRRGEEDSLNRWARRFVVAAERSGGVEGSSVLSAPNVGSLFILVSFAAATDLARWQGSPEYESLLREADRISEAGEYSEVHTGLETWFTLPSRAMPQTPPPKWKMAVATWVAILPIVLALRVVLAPLRLSFLAEAVVGTAIPIALLTWIVMPRLTRLLYRWLYAA